MLTTLADWASLIGLSITVATLFFVLNTRRQIEKVKGELARSQAIADFSTAISTLEEIKRLHRNTKDFQLLPERYATLRKSLINVRATYGLLSPQALIVIQDTVASLTQFEDEVERILAGEREKYDILKWNRLIRNNVDRLQEILATTAKKVE